MQYLVLEGNETLSSLSRLFGQSITSDILAENGIARVPNVAKQWEKQCQDIIANQPKQVSPERKMTLLNKLTDTDDIFEKACLMDDDEWKVFSATQSFTDALKVPESRTLPYSVKVLGAALSKPITTAPDVALQAKAAPSSQILVARRTERALSPSNPVSSLTYKRVMKSLKATGTIGPDIFNTVNTGPSVSLSRRRQGLNIRNSPWAIRPPWGKIQMYSTVLKEMIDFPVYPEELDQNRQASYTSMPDVIYQYEPWITFQNSGPREQSLSFHMHRDLWSGDHRDGQANRLIRFCEANTFADYNGSAVITPLIRFYIDGSLFISGVIKNVEVHWSGPLGLDNWYLEFTLSLAIQEISEQELNCKSFSSRRLKEG